MLFKTFIKTTLQSIAAIIPIVTPIIILLLFISFILHKFRFVEMILPQPAGMRKDGRGGEPLRPFIGC